MGETLQITSGHQEFENKHILILGGGYLGARIYEYLLSSANAHVYLADINLDKCSDPSCQVDVSRRDSVKTLSRDLSKRPDIVFFCVSAKGGDYEKCHDIYLLGIYNVCEFFPESRVVFCSSTSLYGAMKGETVTEDSPSHPLTKEGGILYKAEKYLLERGGISARLSALYGEGRCVLLDRLCNEGLALSGEWDRWLNYVHIEDALTALLLLARLEDISGRTFNVSDSAPLRMGEIYEKLCLKLSLALPEIVNRTVGVRRGGTNQKVSSDLLMSLGWRPSRKTFLDGVYEIVDHKGSIKE